MKANVFIARFPYRNSECPDVCSWLVPTVVKMKADIRIGEIHSRTFDDTPITMTRNLAVKTAKRIGADFLLFIDDDVRPDLGLNPAYGDPIPGAKPFWDTAFNFLLDHDGPAIIGAPYCGPPPWENVYIFKPANIQSNNPNHDVRIEQFTREEAVYRGGIEEVFALPTGLMLIDMRVFSKLPQDVAYFKYEYEDAEETKKATTEDVYFSRNCALAGIKQYCAWPCWVGHWKPKCVGKPKLLTMNQVRAEYREAIVKGHNNDERLVMVGEGRSNLNTPMRPEAIRSIRAVAHSEKMPSDK